MAHAAGRCAIDEAWQTVEGKLPLLSEDQAAHRYEHALEVQLPFLQVLAPGFQFVPITVGTSNFEVLSALGVVIGSVAAEAGEPVLVIASSDMNHYESDEVTRVKDRRAIDQLLALDPRGLYDVVHQADISMCGYGPAVVMLTAARSWEQLRPSSFAMPPPAMSPATATWWWVTQESRCIELRMC